MAHVSLAGNSYAPLNVDILNVFLFSGRASRSPGFIIYFSNPCLGISSEVARLELVYIRARKSRVPDSRHTVLSIFNGCQASRTSLTRLSTCLAPTPLLLVSLLSLCYVESYAWVVMRS